MGIIYLVNIPHKILIYSKYSKILQVVMFQNVFMDLKISKE